MVHQWAAPGRINKILWGTGKSEEKSNKDSGRLGGGYEEWLKDLNRFLLLSSPLSPPHQVITISFWLLHQSFCFTHPFPPLKPSFSEADTVLSPSNKGSLPPILSYGRGQSLPAAPRLLNCGYSSQWIVVPLSAPPAVLWYIHHTLLCSDLAQPPSDSVPPIFLTVPHPSSFCCYYGISHFDHLGLLSLYCNPVIFAPMAGNLTLCLRFWTII